jgi:hypothetical protein
LGKLLMDVRKELGEDKLWKLKSLG